MAGEYHPPPGLWSSPNEIQMDLGRAFEGNINVALSAVADDGLLDASRTFAIDAEGSVTPQ